MSNTSQIAALLLPGVRKLTGDYKALPQQWSLIYASGKSEMQTEKTVAMRYVGLPGLKTQGGQTNFDSGSGQRHTYNHTHIAVGLGYSWTREALDDNLYKAQFDPTNLGLLRSFQAFKEIVAADVLNTGNVYNPQIGGDMVSLFSTQHPVDGAFVANTPTVQVGLNESTLLMANNMVRRFRDDAGILMSAQAKRLVVPVELRHVAKRLMDTELRPGTADNDVNAIKENQDLDSGYCVLDYLTSPTAWFVLSDIGGLIHLERVAFDVSMQVEFTTDNLLVKAYERYYFGYDDWRAGVGFFPSN